MMHVIPDDVSDGELLAIDPDDSLENLLAQASTLRDRGHANRVSFSKKVFIPLTHLCRDVCHYCTYATTPRNLKSAYMSPQAVLEVARAGQSAGCKEALFTLGDKPELRYRIAREELAELGCKTTLDYVAKMAQLVLDETGLLPHINAGVMTAAEIAMLRHVSVSQGLMLESIATRLCEKGGPHYGSPDKDPQRRIATIRAAGELSVPFTSGILIGIGETRAERLASLRALHNLHLEFGHIQEIIVQNFRAKPGTIMANAAEASNNNLLWTVAAARLIFGPDMNIQVPPNLNPNMSEQLIHAGINDWGGISPLTPDFVNPEAPWPQIKDLARDTAAAGKVLLERLAVYPDYLASRSIWIDSDLHTATLRLQDGQNYAKDDRWAPGQTTEPPALKRQQTTAVANFYRNKIDTLLNGASDGAELSVSQIVQLFESRGDEFEAICSAADRLRKNVNGDTVSFVINRNINYTNVCYFRCSFCAFSKGKHTEQLRGKSYNLKLEEIVRRASEAYERGATEVCLQGGIHPQYTGQTYIDICSAIHQEIPELHIHAFSALEVWQGAQTLGISVAAFLEQLQRAGLKTLPGTAAEILHDEVRRQICPDKINTQQWLNTIATAHAVGLKTTSTIMFGHVDNYTHWAHHLLQLRELQIRTGGITEFVPLPFVHMEAPMFLKGQSRSGPSFREAILMHAVARLVLHPFVENIQTSWTKMGAKGAQSCLQAGCNDLGGTLMDESISRAAGSTHGQELTPTQMVQLIAESNRVPQQRTTLYGSVRAFPPATLFDSKPPQTRCLNS